MLALSVRNGYNGAQDTPRKLSRKEDDLVKFAQE
jgi:hypothetical protein